MPPSTHARTTVRRARPTITVVLALIIAAIIGAVLGYAAVPAPSPSAAAPADTQGTPGPASQAPDHPGPPGETGRAVPDGVTVDDGVLPDGVTVFDGEFPAVANLDPDLASALRLAATAAGRDGVEVFVTSGWRSAAYQDQLLREAISEYGSEEEAARWVATAETSAHVTGDAVDIGHAEAMAWVFAHGAEFGLCQTYRNEPWHYELRPDAVDDGCPTPYDDPTQDPRMQQ